MKQVGYAPRLPYPTVCSSIPSLNQGSRAAPLTYKTKTTQIQNQEKSARALDQLGTYKFGICEF